jgi:hypothetical protein
MPGFIPAKWLEDRLVAAMQRADARTPLGQWTIADVKRYDLRQIQEAMIGGHLRDSGFVPPPGDRRCGLHGDACLGESWEKSSRPQSG